MKLFTPLTILHKKFNEMDLMIHAMKSKENFTTETLQYNYRKMFKSDTCIMFCDKKHLTTSNRSDYFIR